MTNSKVLILLFAGIFSSLAAETLRLKPLAGEKIRLDGKLDEKIWQRKADVEKFYPCGPRPPASTSVGTKVFFTSDFENLYIAVHCEEPVMKKIKLSGKKLDDPVWKDDGIEIFLTPSLKSKGYAQIVINADGVVFDLINREPGVTKEELSWNSGIRCKSFKGKDFWSIEAALPFTSLPIDSPDGDWKIHIVRNRAWKKEAFSFVKNIFAYQDTEKFFILSGLNIPGLKLTVSGCSFGEGKYGRNCAQVNLKNWSSKKLTAQISSKEKSIDVPLAPKEEKSAFFFWDQPFSSSRAFLHLTVSHDNKILRTLTYKKELKEVFSDDRNAVCFIEKNKALKIKVPLNVTKATLADAKIRWALNNAEGKTMTSGITTPAGGTALIRLYWRIMKPGTYKLSLALISQGKVMATHGRTLRLINSPFEGI